MYIKNHVFYTHAVLEFLRNIHYFIMLEWQPNSDIGDVLCCLKHISKYGIQLYDLFATQKVKFSWY